MNLTQFISSIVSEDNGSPSTMRIATLLIIAVVLFNWTYFNIQSGGITSFGQEDLIALLGPLLFKGWQKGKESDNQTTELTEVNKEEE